MRESAAARYASVDLTSRVAAADPHELVALLYDKLLNDIDGMQGAASAKSSARFNEARLRAMQTLHALLEGLDPQAGDLAVTLGRLYRGMLASVGAAAMTDDPDRLSADRATIAVLADAWTSIRP